MLTPRQMGFTIRPNKRRMRTAMFNIEHEKLPNEYFTLYYRKNGKFLWRRNFLMTGYFSKGIWSQHPLNMRGRKPKVYYAEGFYDDHYRPYNISMSEFNSFNEALEYFSDYIQKYHPEVLN